MRRAERNWCECGCRWLAKPGNRFICGHRAAKPKRLIRRKACKCGCGLYANPGRTFIKGHEKKKHIWDMPQQAREKISKANTGRVHVEESRSRMSIVQSKIQSLKKKPKIIKECECGCEELASPNMRFVSGHNSRGQEMSAETIIKVSGPNHHNWKGGVATESYCCSWRDQGYKESIRKSDGYKCQNPLCRRTSSRIVLHHINYSKKDCRPTNLITLCNSCNARANHNREFWQEHYESIMKNKTKVRL